MSEEVKAPEPAVPAAPAAPVAASHPAVAVKAILDKHKHDVVGRCWALFHELEAYVKKELG